MSRKKPLLITCIFCGDENVPSSGEDWVPIWLAKKPAYFAEQRHPGQKPVYSDHQYADPETFEADMRERTPGQNAVETRTRGSTPLGDKIPEVCGTCNGGWMSRLEQAVNLVIEGLLSGRPKILDPYDELIIATWSVKTCLTYDASFTDRWIPSEIGTRRLYIVGAPLTHDHVSIGHDPDYVSEGARAEARAHLAAKWPDGETFTAVQFAFQFEHLVIRTVINCFDNPLERRPGIKLPLGSPYHVEVWPRVGRLSWPTGAALTSARVTEEPVPDVTSEAEIDPS